MKRPSGRIDRRYIPMLWRTPLEVVGDDQSAGNVWKTGWLIFSARNSSIYEWGMSVTHEMLHRAHDLHDTKYEGWIEAKARALMRNPRWAAEVYRRIALVCARKVLLSR